MSDVRRDLESIGWREKRIALLESILQDLIAELREVPYKSREVLARQAERRLREVQGE